MFASDIKPLGVRAVAIACAWHANDREGGLFWPSLATLAQEVGVSRDRVKQAIRLLIADGVLQKVEKTEGGRRELTSRYAFRPEWVGNQATRVRALPGDEVPPNPVTSAPPPGNERPPKRDERKALPSLSSKAAPVSAKPATAAAARTPPVARPSRAVGTPTPQKTKQPPTGEQAGSGRAPSVYPWLDDADSLSRRGIELGLQPLPAALAGGMRYGAYLAEAVKRAMKAGEPRRARRE